MNRTVAFSAAGVVALLIAGALLLRSTAPEATPPTGRPAPMGAAPAAAVMDPEVAKKVDEMGARLGRLLARRDELAKSNEAIRKEIQATQTERGLQHSAPGFVAGIIQRMGGATEAQQGAIQDAWLRWHREDQVDQAWKAEDEAQVRARLLHREEELRALLTADQQAKLQTLASWRIRMHWERVATDLAYDLGYPVLGVDPSELKRSRDKMLALMGPAPASPSPTMILPAAHDMDATTLRRLAAERIRAQVPAGQARFIQDPTPEEFRGGIAGSWHYDLQ
jgi:hypothetical protein